MIAKNMNGAREGLTKLLFELAVDGNFLHFFQEIILTIFKETEQPGWVVGGGRGINFAKKGAELWSSVARPLYISISNTNLHGRLGPIWYQWLNKILKKMQQKIEKW